MVVRVFLMGMALVAGVAVPAAASGQASKASRAKAFKLETLSPPAAPAEATPDATAAATPEASATTAAAPPDAGAAPVLPPPAVPDSAAAPTTPVAEGGLRPSFTLDTPIAVLIADPAARAVLDRDLPGMSTDENLDKFAKLGLRQFQPLTGGQLTEAMLAKVARDLSALGGPMLAPIVPTAGGGNSKRNHDASR